MGHSIQTIAEALVFGPYRLQRRGVVSYVIQMMQMVDNEVKMGRSPRLYQKRLKAGMLALELYDAKFGSSSTQTDR